MQSDSSLSDPSLNILFGNALIDGVSQDGWFMGYFIEDHPARCTPDVEVKWGTHSMGDERTQWSTNRTATTLSILIQGCFRLYFPNREILLTQAGDYALWQPGISHNWRAETDSTIITVRFPSTAGDIIEA